MAQRPFHHMPPLSEFSEAPETPLEAFLALLFTALFVGSIMCFGIVVAKRQAVEVQQPHMVSAESRP